MTYKNGVERNFVCARAKGFIKNGTPRRDAVKLAWAEWNFKMRYGYFPFEVLI